MNPDITVSLAKAKALKEAGFDQGDCYFFWVDGERVARQTLAYMGSYYAEEEAVAAPTAEEILRRLPEVDIHTQWVMEKVSFMVNKKRVPGVHKALHFHSDSLADALSKMYIHLAENNLLPSL